MVDRERVHWEQMGYKNHQKEIDVWIHAFSHNFLKNYSNDLNYIFHVVSLFLSDNKEKYP